MKLMTPEEKLKELIAAIVEFLSITRRGLESILTAFLFAALGMLFGALWFLESSEISAILGSK